MLVRLLVRWKLPLAQLISGTMLLLLALISTAQAAPKSDLPQPPISVQQPHAQFQTIDDQFAEIAGRVPAFGGLFLDRNDPTLLHVYLTGDSADVEVTRVSDVIAAVMGQQELVSKTVVIQKAQYKFRELKDWHDRLGEAFGGLNGIVYTDIDEVMNRLEVGVLSDDVRIQAVEKLASANIPEQAVHFEISSPIIPDSLTSHVRPTKGGIKVTHVSPGRTNGGCTLGVNAMRNGVAGFVTASHCGNPGVADTWYYQPDNSSSSYLIGPETVDPVYWPIPGCPFFYDCRYSDSNFSSYSQGVSYSLGKILTGAPIPQPSEFTITEKGSPGLGDTVHMVGMTSGWKSTTVSATCVTIYPGGNMTGKAILCTTATPKVSAGGDSGAPWFVRVGTGTNVRLVGIHHGSNSTNSYYSTITNVQTDLGTLSVCAAGYSC